MSFSVRFATSSACAVGAALALHMMSQAAHTSDTQVPTGASGRSALIIRGPARVIDGDTIDILGKRVRLEGIDAPEINQFCPGATSQPGSQSRSHTGSQKWPAGRIAATSLAQWVDGHEVICRQVGRDGYGRTLGRCRAGNKDLNAELVRTGLAWAFRKYSQIYVRQEETAQASSVGVWARSCQPAWHFRANGRRVVAGNAPTGCAIKGNITRRGRIYHMPWSPWYGRTRIELTKGERWFCDEHQALAAGWRPAMIR